MIDQKINFSVLQTYSVEVGKKMTQSFFTSSKNYISGNEILQFSPIHQLNLLILKNIFEQWKQQVQKSKSVFFDYKNPEVIKAQHAYLNTLSNHIKIDPDNFESLIKISTVQCLSLLLKPWDFYKNEFSSAERISQEFFDDKLRYIKLYPEIKDKFIQTAKKQIKFPAVQNELLTILYELEKSIIPDTTIVNQTLQQFHAIVPVLQEIYKTTPEMIQPDTTETKININSPDQKESLNDKFKSDKTSLSQKYEEEIKIKDLNSYYSKEAGSTN